MSAAIETGFSLPIAANGFKQASADFSRRNDLLSVVEGGRTNVEIIREHNPGVVVLVPIHADSRIDTLRHTLQSIADQNQDLPPQVVIADNGLTQSGTRKINQIGEDLSLPISFADAHPTTDNEKNAAHARNRGLSVIQSLGATDPLFRTDGILLVDSDTALLPGAINELKKSTQEHEGAVAVTARSISIPTLNGETYSRYFTEATQGAREREMPLPLLYSEGKVDIASLVAFGSDVAAKTCGLYLDRAIMSRFDKPFVQMPNGSAEDMIFSVALSRIGETYYNPNAQLLDQTRETVEQTRQQRSNWGRDHAILFSDLATLGYVKPGVHILEPNNGHWEEWVIPGSEEVTGMIINPSQLKTVGQDLLDLISFGQPMGLSTDISRQDIINSVYLMRRLIDFIDGVREKSPRAIHPNLPTPTVADTNHPRFSTNSLTALLAGNIQGMYDIQHIENGVLPKNFFFGVRQAASWK